MTRFGPQKGAQTQFLQTKADIAFYGGAAGGGKTYALLMEAMRHAQVPKYTGAIFRRHHSDVVVSGGLWDTSLELYEAFAKPTKQPPIWQFTGGGKISFGYVNPHRFESQYRGSQFAFLGFDELIDFSEKEFFFLLSRNRTTCGIRPYVRATMNPDADSWVRLMLDWWIGEDGYPIVERGGVVRHFLRHQEQLFWGGNANELVSSLPEDIRVSYASRDEICSYVRTFTFIPASIDDNKILTACSPDYKGHLMSLGTVERERYLKGNWKIKPTAGMYFKPSYFGVCDDLPPLLGRPVRYWDMAGRSTALSKNKGAGDYVCGVKMCRDREGRYIVMDVVHTRTTAGEVEKLVLRTAAQDGNDTIIGVPQDPGSAGVIAAEHYQKILQGYTVRVIRETGSKVMRASPLAASAENGRVLLMRSMWNQVFISELEAFPDGAYDDQVDAASNAYSLLANAQTPKVRILYE